MALSRFVLPFADVGNGITPSSGAKLFFYSTNTSAPLNTFSDAGGATPNTNPVISDANGVFSDIFLLGTYKVVLKDKNNVQKWEADPVEGSQNNSVSYAVSQLANGDATKVAVLSVGLNVAAFDYLVYPNDGRIYIAKGVTGVTTGAFNPATGVAAGLSQAVDLVDFMGFGSMYAYAVSQLAAGNASKVALIYPGLAISAFDFFVYTKDGRIYAKNGRTGTFSNPLAFNPATGTDSGISGALLVKSVTSIETNIATNTTNIATINAANNIYKTVNESRVLELDGTTLKAAQAFGYAVGGSGYVIAAATVVTLPTLASHTDYKVFGKNDGTLVAQTWATADPANSCLVGGFHAYHTTATCNPFSIWDQGYRPKCSPRAMTQGQSGLWVDIYLADTAYGVNGYSRGSQTIADGSSAPIIPTFYGGNGSTTYGNLTWFVASDLVINAGKRLPFWTEFTGLAYGVVEQQAVGSDPVTTKYQAGHRSACGMEQATGVINQWGADTQGSGSGWSAITSGRGSVFSSALTAILLGASWPDGVYSGSRSAVWSDSPGNSGVRLGCRAVCDHMHY